MAALTAAASEKVNNSTVALPASNSTTQIASSASSKAGSLGTRPDITDDPFSTDDIFSTARTILLESLRARGSGERDRSTGQPLIEKPHAGC
jgi:hypothetical protein